MRNWFQVPMDQKKGHGIMLLSRHKKIQGLLQVEKWLDLDLKRKELTH
jgi:hypothetical protein